MYSLIRPLLFALDPEFAHGLALKALRFYPRQTLSVNEDLHYMGLSFPHRIGLAAGFDKNGEYVAHLAKLGFSFIEVGTVTPKAQIGNPKPRLFRIPQAQAIINRMGFNNAGVEALGGIMQQTAYQGILGVNIGKNKDTSLHNAAEDYVFCLEQVYSYASYVTINISSPNTPDLRHLQQKEYLQHLLLRLKEKQQQLEMQYQRTVPLVLKISPDEQPDTVKQIVALAVENNIAGMIVSNTTCEREGVRLQRYGDETGGLSGRPLLARSTACLELVKKEVGNALVLIGSGGIFSLEDAQLKLAAGADLIQLYSGLIYQGPQLIRTLVQGLRNR